MGAIHGNETPAAEDSLEFAYDVLLQAKTNPKVAALLDKVRLIDLPLDQPRRPRVQERRGQRRPAPRELRSVGAIVPPATCSTTGVDLNRNYPFGWGSNIGVSPGRSRQPARAPSPRSRTRWTSCSPTRS